MPPDCGGYVSEANRLLIEWNLGIAFRAVFRRDAVRQLRGTTATDEFADVVWVYGACLGGPLLYVPESRYRKRIYPASTHASWRRHPHPLVLPFLLREILDRPDLPERDATIAELVDGSVAQSMGLIDEAAAERVEIEKRRQARRVARQDAIPWEASGLRPRGAIRRVRRWVRRHARSPSLIGGGRRLPRAG